MEKSIPINDLSEMSDAYLLWGRTYGKQEGAYLVLVTQPAFELFFGMDHTWYAWIFIPMDIIDALVTMFDDAGLDLSYG